MKRPGIAATETDTSTMSRWTERADEAGDEGRAGALLRLSARPEPLAADALAAVWERLEDGRRAPPARRLVWQIAVGAALMLCGGGLLAAADHVLRRPQPSPPSAPASRPAAPVMHRARPAPPPAAPAVEPPPPEAPPPEAPAAPEARALDRAPRARALLAPPAAPAASAPARESALAEESRLLGSALRRLRQDGDAQGALALLDEHTARFGSGGALAPEAEATRIEALVRLGRHAEALRLLDGLGPAPARRELRATRGELRAQAGRCAEALADFDALLVSGGADDAVTERAFWGRAGCRARGADADGARADLTDYLARFPRGRFAERARAALGR
jgi:hypothetical protein